MARVQKTVPAPDHTPLASMGNAALAAAGSDQITVLADRGHYNSEQVLEHDGAGILLCVPMVDTSGRVQ
ncbi:hypothetical protein ACKU27_25935 [Sphingobium yanoikuyae]